MPAPRGFTLIELLVILTLIAVILGLGVPSLSATVRENRLATATNSLSRVMSLARSTAIKHGQSTTLCQSHSQWSCDDTMAGSWTAGWVVFTDPARVGDCKDNDRNGLCDGHDGRIIRQGSLHLPQHVTVHSNGGWNAERVTFTALGSASGFMRTFTICDNRSPETARELILAMSGRLRLVHHAGLESCPN